MSPSLTSPKNGNVLRVLDPDLPFLAAEAAVDIDNLLSSRSEDLTAIRRLAEQLKNSLKLRPLGEQPRSLMDPATLTVLGEAMLKVLHPFPPSKFEDLLSEASKIAEELSNAEPTSNPKEMQKARNFCLALSRAAAAYSKSIRDLRPSHPFRR